MLPCPSQTWKNETLAEQEKRSPTEKPVLLSKDIEAKLTLLDREVNYLLNKAKFAKPKPKVKPKENSTSTENGKSNSTEADSEKVIPPVDKPNAEKATGIMNVKPVGHVALCLPVYFVQCWISKCTVLHKIWGG